MSFVLSGSVVTQSGIDTSFSGLGAIAGVTTIATNSGFIYYMPTLQLKVEGTLTILDQAMDSLICNRLQINPTGNYTSGKFAVDGVTPFSAGTHFQCVGTALDEMPASITVGALAIATGGQFTIIGGDYKIAGGVYYQTGAVVREYGTSVIATVRRGATTSVRVRAYSANVIKRNVKHYDIGYDLFVMPTEYSVQAFGSEYVAQYVGSAAGGIDAKFTASALSNVDGVKDFENYGAGWVELYNCSEGAGLTVTRGINIANHCTPLFQTITIKVTDLTGVVKQNIKYKCVDAPVSNSPTVLITTLSGLKTWDFRSPIVYSGITDISGLASVSPVLQVWHGDNIKNLRFPSSTATFKFRAYDSQSQDTSIVLGSNAAQSINMAIPTLQFITLSEATAGTLTGISIVPSGASGGTVTISSAHTVLELFHYYRYWISQYDNFNSNDTWTYDGTVLNIGAWAIIGVEFLNSGTITSPSITSSGAMANISFIGNVIQNTATSLTNVGVSGVLIYNDATSKSIVFSGCNINEVRNDGIGIISIAGGTITTYTDAQINFLNSSATILLPTGYNVFTLHLSSTDADAGINAVFTGTDVTNTIQYKAESFGGTTLWIRATISGDLTTEIYRGQAVPVGIGNYTFSAVAFSESVQLAAILSSITSLEAKVDSKPSAVETSTAVWSNITRTITNPTVVDNEAIAGAVWVNTVRTTTDTVITVNEIAMATVAMIPEVIVPTAGEVATSVWANAIRTTTDSAVTIPTAVEVATAVWDKVMP